MRAVLEVDLAGRRALDAELALLGADREARVVLVHDERRDPVRALRRVGRPPSPCSSVETPALVIQHFVPLSTQCRRRGPPGCASPRRPSRPPARTARSENIASPRGDRRQVPPASAPPTPDRISGIVPSLLTAGISEDDGAGAGDLLDDDRGGDRVGARRRRTPPGCGRRGSRPCAAPRRRPTGTRRSRRSRRPAGRSCPRPARGPTARSISCSSASR